MIFRRVALFSLARNAADQQDFLPSLFVKLSLFNEN